MTNTYKIVEKEIQKIVYQDVHVTNAQTKLNLLTFYKKKREKSFHQ